MRSSARTNKHTVSSRRGVSFVEFVGCLIALCGGVLLGSMYLGVDVQTMAVGLLDKADIKVPQLLRGGEVATAEATTDEVDSSATPEDADISSETQGETLSESDEEVSHLEDVVEGNEEVVEAPVSVERRELTDEEKLIATRVYWEGLNSCWQEEVKNRSQGMKDPGNWQLFDYLIHRKRCHEAAVEAIGELDRFGVDARLTAHADQVLSWQRTGVQLFDRATYLLTDAPAGKLTGPFAQSWQSAATQHRMEERLIQNKHAAVANYVEHTLKVSAEIPSAQ